jgi:osmotically-inducible protein OsmY
MEQNIMTNCNRLCTWALALLLGASLSGCATFEKCAAQNCAGDAQITADVRAALSEHPDLGAPAALRVQTINRVVYLNGLVDTELQRTSAETYAMRVANVKDVVNSIAIRNAGR